MAFLAPALPLIAGGLAVMQGVAGMRANQQNAANASAEAGQELLTSKAEADRIRRQNAFTLSEFRAGVGAQGTTFEGSPMMAYLENVKQGELEVQDALFGGKIRSRSRRMEADIFSKQAPWALIGGVTQGVGLASSLLRK